MLNDVIARCQVPKPPRFRPAQIGTTFTKLTWVFGAHFVNAMFCLTFLISRSGSTICSAWGKECWRFMECPPSIPSLASPGEWRHQVAPARLATFAECPGISVFTGSLVNQPYSLLGQLPRCLWQPPIVPLGNCQGRFGNYQRHRQKCPWQLPRGP